jgi:MFS family permease
MERDSPEHGTDANGIGSRMAPSVPSVTGNGAEIAAEASRSPKNLKQTFSSLGQSSYRNLWFGMLLHIGAAQMQTMTRGFLVYDLTRSPTLFGVVIASSTGPALALALFGGLLADRREKKLIIQAGQGVSVVMALFIAVSITTGTITWQHLLVGSIVQGTVMCMISPARHAIIPQLVGQDRVMNAIALNSMGMSLATVVGPAVAGWLITVIGVGGVYYVMAGMYVGAAVLTGLVPRAEGTSERANANAPVFADLMDGLRYVVANRVLLHLLLIALATVMLAFPIRFMLPIFAEDVFAVGSEGLGVMLGVMGIGSIGGALFIAAMGRLARRGLLLAATGVVSGVVLVGFSAMSFLAPAFWAALGFMALIGLIQSGRITLNNSLLLERTDQQYRGRVMSIWSANFSLMPAGVLPLTIATEFIGAPLALGIMALPLIVISATFAVTSSHLRQLE